MDKINELKESLICDLFPEDISGFNKGFDAAMELQLDAIEKFMVWLPHNYHVSQYYEWTDDKTHYEMEGIDIFKNFLENIYQPE